VVNVKLQEKLAVRGETLEEREERRARRRAARIASQFGYTAQDNPFNDPNLAETFTWKKKDEVNGTSNNDAAANPSTAANCRKDQQSKIITEIHKVRTRRTEAQEHRDEMDRIRAEESRMKELEKYDDWAAKEEEFHLQKLRQRSAIRLVEGRETPIDVLAKNLLLFGLTDEEKKNRAAVKYKERYSALEELETLEVELEEPHVFIRDLKLGELELLDTEIVAFKTLEREAATQAAGELGKDSLKNNPVLLYWDALHLVTVAEINHVRSNGDDYNTIHDKDHETTTTPSSNAPSPRAMVEHEIQSMFEGQSTKDLQKMKSDVQTRLHSSSTTTTTDPNVDVNYWNTVLDQLVVHLAKLELSDIHSRMLVCQLEKLERRKEELGNAAPSDPSDQKGRPDDDGAGEGDNGTAGGEVGTAALPLGVAPDFGNLEEELGLADEVDLAPTSFAWQERYRPRKPRYFNRVKTGYDWNKYNQTHYDHDNPPPKTVQGYKFNVFYPDLIDRNSTPTFMLEATEHGEFCIIRFKAGPPYEDVAFKIINRQWNRSRKRGYRSTFERGVLTLYFNFASHWYRR